MQTGVAGLRINLPSSRSALVSGIRNVRAQQKMPFAHTGTKGAAIMRATSYRLIVHEDYDFAGPIH
jgi:hypothetical protein